MRLSASLLGLLFITPALWAESFYSEWDSNFNRVYMTQDGNSVSGRYDYAGGLISGNFEGQVLKGWWSETDDNRNCGPDNQWSGPFVLTFSADGRSFTGVFGKCASGQTDFTNLSGDWHGSLHTGTTSFISADDPKTKVSLAGFEHRKGPFSNSEDDVGDFSDDLYTTQGIVQMTNSGRAVAGGEMAPQDVDISLFGHSASGPVSVAIFPCSYDASLRLLDAEGKELAATRSMSNGYSGIYAELALTNAPAGVYAIEVKHTGKQICSSPSWYVAVTANLTDPETLINVATVANDKVTREDAPVDDLLNDLKSILRQHEEETR